MPRVPKEFYEHQRHVFVLYNGVGITTSLPQQILGVAFCVILLLLCAAWDKLVDFLLYESRPR